MCEEKKEKFRTYSSYCDIDEVCEIFGYRYISKPFVEEKEYKMPDIIEADIREDFADLKNFINEFVICESIIRPIIANVARKNKLPLFSHCKLEYDKELGLSGEPDYFLAPLRDIGSRQFTTPVVCLGEAKKDNFVQGWAQVFAEMIAAQKLNDNKDVTIYGLVSTGKNWEFGCLKDEIFTIDSTSFAAPGHLTEVLNILNWMFCEARKNADILEKLKNDKK